jgi:hypothetical protein
LEARIPAMGAQRQRRTLIRMGCSFMVHGFCDVV